MAFLMFSLALLFAFVAFIWLKNQNARILEGKSSSDKSRKVSKKEETKGAPAGDRINPKKSFLIVTASHDTKITLRKGSSIVKKATNGALNVHLTEGDYKIEILYPSGFKATKDIHIQNSEPIEYHINSGILKLNYTGKPNRVACELKLVSSKHSFSGKFRKMIEKGETTFVLPEGNYEVELQANGNYIPFKTTVDVRAKNESVVNAEVLQPGVLDFYSQRGAKVFLDNRLIGEIGSLKPIKVLPGRHIVRILFPSGFDYRESIDVKNGGRTTIRLDVEKVKFRMLNGPKVARLDISLNGRRSSGKLRVELPLNKTLVLTLPTGNYTYSIEGSGFHPVKRVINLKSGHPLTIEEKLQPSRRSQGNRGRRHYPRKSQNGNRKKNQR